MKIDVFEGTRSVRPNISRRRGRPPPTHSSCQKTRMNDLSCGIRMWAKFSIVLSMRAIDRLTDRKALAIPCVALHAVARQKFAKQIV